MIYMTDDLLMVIYHEWWLMIMIIGYLSLLIMTGHGWWLIARLSDWLIDDKIMITRSVMMPKVSGLYRPTGLLFSNWIVSVIFHPIFLIFGLNMHNIAPKPVEFAFWFLALNFLLIFNYKKEGFLATWFRGILCVLPGVCKKWPLWAKFSGPFWPRIVPILGQRAFFTYFAIGFHWI